MNHYTDLPSYNAIRAQLTWCFSASKPPGNHPFGAYFTTLTRQDPKLAKKLRIPKTKVEYVFEFTDAGDLDRLSGGRGEYIFYSPVDYLVEQPRQLYHGAK